MPKLMVETYFDLGDYFNKYGFGDGDDGTAKDAGYNWRFTAIEILNSEFKRSKLGIVFDDEGPESSLHNSCTIGCRMADGAELDVSADDDRLDLTCVQFDEDEKANDKVVERVKKAFARAYHRFEERVLKSSKPKKKSKKTVRKKRAA